MTATASAPSSLARCGHCGYWLAGLPSAGNCPECGQGYDDGRIILRGWGRGSHGGLLRSRGLAFIWIALCQVLFFGYPLATVVGRGAGSAPVYSFLVLSILGVALAFILSRWAHPVAETVSVTLCPAGFQQNTIPARWGVAELLLAVSGAGLLFVWIQSMPAAIPRGSWNTPIAVIVVMVLAIAVVMKLARLRNAPMTSWPELLKLRLHRERSGRYLLSLHVRPTWARHRDAVHAEFDLSPEQAAELRRRIEIWQPLARERE